MVLFIEVHCQCTLFQQDNPLSISTVGSPGYIHETETMKQ